MLFLKKTTERYAPDKVRSWHIVMHDRRYEVVAATIINSRCFQARYFRLELET